MFMALDTDILLYRAASAAETEIEWDTDIWSLYTDLKEAKSIFNAQIENIKQRLQVEDFICCLSDHKSNFRKEIDPSYKSNRKGTRKPVGYTALVDWVRDTYKSLSKPSLEADDVMSLLATKEENIGKCIIVSDDKDMLSCPTKVYRPTRDELLDIRPAQADAYFFTQVLTGDTADGYPGCKGVGEKTAAKILGNRPTWSSVEQAFIKAGLTKEDALTQARLARILRWEDWDQENQKPILWRPK